MSSSLSIGLDDIAVLIAKIGRIRIYECLRHLDARPNVHIPLMDVANAYMKLFKRSLDAFELFRLFDMKGFDRALVDRYFKDEIRIVRPDPMNPVFTLIGSQKEPSLAASSTASPSDEDERETITLAASMSPEERYDPFRRPVLPSQPITSELPRSQPSFVPPESNTNMPWRPPFTSSAQPPPPVPPSTVPMGCAEPQIIKGRFTTRVIYPVVPKVINMNDVSFEESFLFPRPKKISESTEEPTAWPPRDGSVIMAAPKVSVPKKKVKKGKKGTKKSKSSNSESGIHSSNSVELESEPSSSIPEFLLNHQSAATLVPELKEVNAETSSPDSVAQVEEPTTPTPVKELKKRIIRIVKKPRVSEVLKRKKSGSVSVTSPPVRVITTTVVDSTPKGTPKKTVDSKKNTPQKNVDSEPNVSPQWSIDSVSPPKTLSIADDMTTSSISGESTRTLNKPVKNLSLGRPPPPPPRVTRSPPSYPSPITKYHNRSPQSGTVNQPTHKIEETPTKPVSPPPVNMFTPKRFTYNRNGDSASRFSASSKTTESTISRISTSSKTAALTVSSVTSTTTTLTATTESKQSSLHSAEDEAVYTTDEEDGWSPM